MRNFKWEVLEHPPYSPGFHLVGPLKHYLLAEHFPDDEAVERELAACVPTAPQRILWCWFSGACETMGQVPQCIGKLCREIRKSIFQISSLI
jgi:hypothetical protein